MMFQNEAGNLGGYPPGFLLRSEKKVFLYRERRIMDNKTYSPPRPCAAILESTVRYGFAKPGDKPNPLEEVNGSSGFPSPASDHEDLSEVIFNSLKSHVSAPKFLCVV